MFRFAAAGLQDVAANMLDCHFWTRSSTIDHRNPSPMRFASSMLLLGPVPEKYRDHAPRPSELPAAEPPKHFQHNASMNCSSPWCLTKTQVFDMV